MQCRYIVRTYATVILCIYILTQEGVGGFHGNDGGGHILRGGGGGGTKKTF